MQNTGLNGGDSRGSLRAAVISKLKDDGDYDRLRLKIIRKIKENVSLFTFLDAISISYNVCLCMCDICHN